MYTVERVDQFSYTDKEVEQDETSFITELDDLVIDCSHHLPDKMFLFTCGDNCTAYVGDNCYCANLGNNCSIVMGDNGFFIIEDHQTITFYCGENCKYTTNSALENAQATVAGVASVNISLPEYKITRIVNGEICNGIKET